VRDRVADLVVVGGGAMGLATAWRAAAAGLGVVLIEQFEFGHVRGASHGTERIFRYGYTDRTYVRLAVAAEDGWRQLETDSGRPLLDRIGCVDHGAGDELEEMAAACEAEGVAIEWLDADRARRRWPGLRFASSVLFQPGAGRIRAADALDALRAQATAGGAELHQDELVIQLVPDQEWVRVITEVGAYVAPVVVVTAGAWTGPLLFGHVDLPLLTTTCERVAYFECRDPSDPWPSFIHRDTTSYYGQPGPPGLVKLGAHHTGPVTTGDTRSFDVDPPALADLSEYASEWLPGLDAVPVDATTCLYTSTPTEDFVLDRTGPIVVGAGFSGHGFKFVPEIGRLLAAMAKGEPAPGNPFTLGPGRRAGMLGPSGHR
jgi:sarcosine oxidase